MGKEERHIEIIKRLDRIEGKLDALLEIEQKPNPPWDYREPRVGPNTMGVGEPEE